MKRSFNLILFTVFIINCHFCNAQSSSGGNPKQDESILDFMRKVIVKHGPEKVQGAFDNLDQRSLAQVMRILVGAVDKQLVADILDMHEYAEKSNKVLLEIINRANSGDHTVVFDVFGVDEKLIRFPWWRRLRRRVLKNIDKYVSDFN